MSPLTSRNSTFRSGFANCLERLEDSLLKRLRVQKNPPVFNDITALSPRVWLPTFIDFTLTKCHIVRLDSVKGATNGNSPYFQ